MDVTEALRYGATTLLSAAAGIVAERTLQVSSRFFAPLWYHSGGRVLRKRRRNVESRLRVGVGSAFTLGRGGHELYVLEFAPQGFDPRDITVGPVDGRELKTLWEQTPPQLRPAPWDALEARLAAERDDLDRDPSSWNANRYVLRRAVVGRTGDEERPTLDLAFGVSDYATKRVVTSAWEQMRATDEQARHLEESRLRTVLPGLSHSFGINLTIVTADNSVILTRRSAATSTARGLRHISVNEGMSIEDRVGGYPDPYATAIRGTQEELGVDLSDHRDRIVLHALILDVTRYEWAFVGHVDLRDTDLTDAVFRMHRGVGISTDAWESDHLELEPWTAASARRLLESDRDWVGHGYLNLLLSAVHSFPRARGDLLEQARRALA